MNKFFIGLIKFAVQFKIIRKLSKLLNWQSSLVEAQIICKKISPSNKVLSGPFEGLQYRSLESAGSALVPKILGSYEDELHELVYKLIQTPYKKILDVGCAEGYYAIGMAMRIPSATVFAYDVDEIALELCRGMAEENKVSDKIKFGGLCDAKLLSEFDFKERSLIICDSEGYEKELFQDLCIPNLNNCDLLVELHSNIYPDIFSVLKGRFEKTHDVQEIPSKLKRVIDYPQLKILNRTEYNDLILIERDITISWGFFKTKNSSSKENK